MDDNPQGQVTQIAVAPIRAGRIRRGYCAHDFEELILGIVLAQVEIVGIVREAGGVAQQFANGDLGPPEFKRFNGDFRNIHETY